MRDQKFVGVWFNEELKWRTYVKKLKSELSRSVGWTQKNSKSCSYLDKENAVLYFALLENMLQIFDWGRTDVCNYIKLIVVQKRVLHLLENYKGNIIEFNSPHNFTTRAILKANQVYYFELLKAIYKQNVYGRNQESSNNQFTFRHDTRRKPSMRTNYGKQENSYQAPNLHNRVHNNLAFLCLI